MTARSLGVDDRASLHRRDKPGRQLRGLGCTCLARRARRTRGALLLEGRARPQRAIGRPPLPVAQPAKTRTPSAKNREGRMVQSLARSRRAVAICSSTFSSSPSAGAPTRASGHRCRGLSDPQGLPGAKCRSFRRGDRRAHNAHSTAVLSDLDSSSGEAPSSRSRCALTALTFRRPPGRRPPGCDFMASGGTKTGAPRRHRRFCDSTLGQAHPRPTIPPISGNAPAAAPNSIE